MRFLHQSSKPVALLCGGLLLGVCLGGALPGLAAEKETDAVTSAESSLATAIESIKMDDVRRHISFLASDTLEGREAGTRGGKAAAAYLRERFEKLPLAPGNGDGYYQEFGNDHRNLLGFLPGDDPQLRDEVIVIGAHYDHVGYGYSGNSRGRPGNIHNGADDNASGVATLLEIAQAFKSLPQAPRRSILFALWDGEELGLLGSRHWASEPTLDFSRVRFYINLDMVGRLRENSLDVYGIRTGNGLRALCARNNHEGIVCKFDWDLIPDSDHYPFLQRRVPFLMPFTRKHEDYHLPTDDADKIEYEGVERIGRHWFRVIHELAQQEQLPKFRLESLREHEGLRRESESSNTASVSRLGVSWNSEESTRDRRLIIKSVTADSPAARAGLVPGDEILELNGLPFQRSEVFIRDMLRSTSQSEFLVVKRSAGETVSQRLPISLKGEPVRVGFGWRLDAAEPGVLILNQIVPFSPAADAGLLPNDRVLSINGRMIDPAEETERLLTSSDSRIEIEFDRQGVPQTLQLERRELLTPPLTAPRP